MPVDSHSLTRSYARTLDEQDPLKEFRHAFHIPKHHGHAAIYFCGNSLGLQPKSTAGAIEEELSLWKEKAVEGWFQGNRPWLAYQNALQDPLACIVGAQPEEVVVMNTLTVNLHLLLVSFYRPDRRRFKIIVEAGAFPSDQYAISSQVRFHGYSPEEAIIEVNPRAGEICLRTEDIVRCIEQHASDTALVLFGGVNYYTGQFFDLPAITRAAHKAGAIAGFDLAHAAGNVVLQLHDWDVDFAVWCSYKYLNSGPGGPGGVFVHARHSDQARLPRFAGWWGHDEAERFLMQKDFHPIPGAAGWQVSTAQILSMAPLRVSLELFDRAAMPRLRAKSELMTAYLCRQLEHLNINQHRYQTLSPAAASERGSQISIYLPEDGQTLFERLTANGVICDWREDNLFNSGGGIIRVAPAPLYNTFEEIYQFCELLEKYFLD